MVRSVSEINPNGFNKLLLSGRKNTKNAAKHVGLPAKITLSALGLYGTDKVIGDQKSDTVFKMSCGIEYEHPEQCISLFLYGPS